MVVLTEEEYDKAIRKAQEDTLDLVYRLIMDEDFLNMAILLSALPEDQFESVAGVLKVLKK